MYESKPLTHNRDLFIQDPSCYTRNLEIVEEAIQTAAHFLNLKTEKPLEECLAYMRATTAEGGKRELKPISVKGLRQADNGDRVKSSIKIDKLLRIIKRNNHILSPNMAVYMSPKVKRSPIVIYIRTKMAKRKVVKKKGQEAEQLNDFEMFAACNNEEYAIKLLLNSISGAHASPYNPLWNESAHSTLTSMARVNVSYPNASTERFLMGNRHYWSKDVVLENILTITRNTDYANLETVIAKYYIHIPSVDEVMVMIKRATDLYWTSKRDLNAIQDLVEKLSPIQRTAYLYTGDFYSLYQLNESLVRNMFEDLLNVQSYIDETASDEYLDKIVYGVNSGIGSLACVYCEKFFRGSTLSKVKSGSRENYVEYANTILHIEFTLLNYSDLLTTLYRTNNLPSSIFRFPSSIRRAVIGSDTDSVMYTVQQQVIWYYGKIMFGPKISMFSNTMSFLNNMVIDHCLAVTAKQMGVDDDDLFTLRMKNEFEFIVYAKANRAKHYGTLMTMKEGIVFKEPKSEIKGVGLKDSKIPKYVMKSLEEELVRVMIELVENENISIFPVMQKIANLEHLVHQSLLRGEITYMVGVNINSEDGYKKPDSSNYLHYKLWRDVFAKKFGTVSEPPYRAIKVSTIVKSPSQFKLWADSINEDISAPLILWMTENNKKGFTQILLPLEIVSSGLPKEFMSLINMRATVASISKGYYILLETLGMYFGNKHNTQLVSDKLPYRPEYGLPGGELDLTLNSMENEEEDDYIE
jgi:hypothetical protein